MNTTPPAVIPASQNCQVDSPIPKDRSAPSADANGMILGIDPGVGGGLAFYFPSRPLNAYNAAYLFDMPVTPARRGKTARDVDVSRLAALINDFASHGYYIRKAVVEIVTSRPRQAGQFAFGLNYGRILGTLEYLGIPIVHVAPGHWKQVLGLRGEEKATSVKLAAALFTGMGPSLYGKRGAPLDGRAEALLLSYYGARYSGPAE